MRAAARVAVYLATVAVVAAIGTVTVRDFQDESYAPGGPAYVGLFLIVWALVCGLLAAEELS